MQIKIDDKVYKLTFESDYGTLDTIECNGKFLTSNHRVCKRILNNIDQIQRGTMPKGMELVSP